MTRHGTLRLQRDRPLAALDLEATGTAVRADRIVEICVVKVWPDDRREVHTLRVNPQIPIPPEATAIHGIRDADVANCPTFAALAPQILALLEGCDLLGYNITRFDIPMLTEEFHRAGIPFSADDRRVIDVQRIFHRREPRDLGAALAFYCGEMQFDAHAAEADALATLRVLEGQFDRYADLPRDVEALDRYCNPREPDWADRTGKLRWVNGEIVLNFGKRKGESLRTIVQEDPGFAKWIARGDFPRDTRALVLRALEGKWPARSETAALSNGPPTAETPASGDPSTPAPASGTPVRSGRQCP